MDSGAFVLVVTRGDEQRVHRFDQDLVLIGRAAESDLRLDDRLVSRRHCSLERRNGSFTLRDEGAQNRPRVRGQPVEVASLVAGETFLVGPFSVQIQRAVAEPSGDATLLPEAQPSAAELGEFLAIARALNEQQDLAPLLTAIVDAAIRLTEAERGFLLLGQGDQATVEVARNFAQEEVLSPEFKISRTIARRVMDTGVAELTTNAQEDARFRSLASVTDLRLRSVLCVPIRQRGRICGVLYVDNRLQQQVLAEKQRAILVALADHAGTAIHNARTLEELRRQQAELETAMDRVAKLNAALKGQVAAQQVELDDMQRELAGARPHGQWRYDYGQIIGDSRRMTEVFRLLDRYVESDDPVLILGESGTGKELVARAIHSQGRRARGPFVSENCAALPESLLESELFGHVKGAFTGATANKKGLLAAASGGVLFLDEIGDMPLELQAKLLRVLQEGEVRPIGGNETVRVDLRLITATNRDLETMVREGEFREDLYYRLNVLPVRLPPLRERREDIPKLVDRFLLEISREINRRVRITPDALNALTAHAWPGNVRELQNEVRRAAILGDGVILKDHLRDVVREPRVPPGGVLPAEAGTTLPDMVQELEVRMIQQACSKASGNKSRAAEMLGLSRFALQRKLDKYGIDPESPERRPEASE